MEAQNTIISKEKFTRIYKNTQFVDNKSMFITLFFLEKNSNDHSKKCFVFISLVSKDSTPKKSIAPKESNPAPWDLVAQFCDCFEYVRLGTFGVRDKHLNSKQKKYLIHGSSPHLSTYKVTRADKKKRSCHQKLIWLNLIIFLLNLIFKNLNTRYYHISFWKI